MTTPLGVDARFFPRTATRRRAVLGPLALTHGRYFLAVGTLEPRKNILTDARCACAPAAARARSLSAGRGRHVGLADTTPSPGGSKQPVRAARSGCSAMSATSSCRCCTPARRCCRTRRSTKASACRRSRPWRAGSPSPSPNRASLPEVVGDAGILARAPRRRGPDHGDAPDRRGPAFADDLAARGIARAQTFTWERCAALTMECWEQVTGAAAR